MKARTGAAIVAVIGWAAVLSFLVANTRASGSLPQAIWWSFGFLTDWSNWAVVLATTAVALDWRRLSAPIVTAVATAAILLVGLMYGILGGWAKLGQQPLDSLVRWSDLLAHVVTPAAMVLAWLTCLPHGGLRWRDAPRFMLFPLAYLVEMFGRGLLGGGYPYSQADVPQVGWAAALTFSGAVAMLFFVLGLLLVLVDKALAKRAAAAA